MKRSLSKLRPFGFVAISFLIFSQADAAPSAFTSKFGALTIQNPTPSTLLRDSDQSNVVWVLPPPGGMVEMSQFSPSSNLNFCGGLKALAEGAVAIDKKMAELTKRLDEQSDEYQRSLAELAAARKAFGEIEPPRNAQEIVQLQSDLFAVEKKIDANMSSLSACQQTCEVLHEERQRLILMADEIRQQILILSSESHEVSSRYAIGKARVEQCEENIAALDERILKTKALLRELRSEMLDVYSHYAKLEGGTTFVSYQTGWQESVAQLNKLYPEFEFRMLPTSHARIFANIAGRGTPNYYESLPALLDYSIGNAEVIEGFESSENSALPSVINGTFRLSLVGACPLAQKNFFEGSEIELTLGRNGTPLYGISATYTYPSVFKYNVRASYNLFKIYEQFRKGNSLASFVSPESFVEHVFDNSNADAFHIEWSEEDPENQLSADERIKVIGELKQDLFGRLMNSLGEPLVNPELPAGNQPLLLPPESGAMVAGKEIERSCPLNIYCKVSSWIFKTIAGSIGEASYEEKVRQKFDRTAIEEWSTTEVKWRPAIVAFSQKGSGV